MKIVFWSALAIGLFFTVCWLMSWKAVGPLWMQWLGGKIFPSLKWSWGKSWPPLKSSSRWLWAHKTEKKVWATLSALAFVTVIILGGIAVSRVINPTRGISLSISGWGWLPIIAFAAVCLAIEALLIILHFQKTLSGKLHGIIGAIIAGLLALIALVTFVPWREAARGFKTLIGKGWDWYLGTVPYPLIVLAVLAGLLLLILLFRRKKAHGAHPPGARTATASHAHGHGQGSSILGMAVMAFILIFAILGVWSTYNNTLQTQGRVFPVVTVAVPATPVGVQSFKITASPTTWTAVQVGFGWHLAWVKEKTVHVRFNNEPAWEDDNNAPTTLRLPERVGPYNVYFMGKGQPVDMTIILSPI